MLNLDKKSQIIDSHCHLNNESGDPSINIGSVLNDANATGVVLIQNICTTLSSFDKLYNTTIKYPQVFTSVGTHPLNVAKEGVAHMDQIMQHTTHKKVTCIGEVGLDYHYSPSTDDIIAQKENFIAHIRAAQEANLPLIVHTRDAEKDTAIILQQEFKRKPFLIVMHCYTAGLWLMEECLPIVAAFSASGIITFKNAKDVCNIFSKIPESKLLIETDSPYLAPIPHRGKRNSPAYLNYVCDKLAEIKNTSCRNIAEITTENFLRIFTKAYIV